MKAKIHTITMKLGDREIVLTEDEAKALREQLNNLFGEVPATVIHNYPERRERHLPWKMPDIICQAEQREHDRNRPQLIG